ncbi:MAG: NifU family protein [Planctomycetes bacterium]|nr:NifU family protein [Planctomycetota bacterium]
MTDISLTPGNLDEDSDALDLALDRPVAGATPVYFDDPEEARAYPLAQRLLGLDCVSALLLQDRKITVCRSNRAGDWPSVIEAVGEIVRDHFAHLPEAQPTRERTPAENELMARIQNLLNTEINPMVASHGGFIEVRDVRETRVLINMTGGCQGCGMAAQTLKQGVERIIFDRIPEVTEILDSTDHAAGVNPYY